MCFIAVTATSFADTIHRRGGDPPLVGTIAPPLTDRGVRFLSESGAEQLVPWDRIRTVEMDTPPPDVDDFLALADDLWRARTRLQRRDVMLSEPLFERHFPRYQTQTNATALLVAEGLLRCRLIRGDMARAIEPALTCIRLRRADITHDAFDHLPPIYDETFQLITALPPVMMLNDDPRSAATDPVIAALHNLYHGRILNQPPDHPGVDLVQALRAVIDGDDDAHAAARAKLSRRLDDPDAPAWLQAWVHTALGLSLTAESGTGQRQRGLVHLLHLPARHSTTHPWLAAFALHRAAATLTDLNDHEAAASLNAERTRRFPMFTFPGSRAVSQAIRIVPHLDTPVRSTDRAANATDTAQESRDMVTISRDYVAKSPAIVAVATDSPAEATDNRAVATDNHR